MLADSVTHSRLTPFQIKYQYAILTCERPTVAQDSRPEILNNFHGGMMRLRILMCVMAASFAFFSFAQDFPADSGLVSSSEFSMFQRGDSLLTLSAGTSLGIGFLDAEGTYRAANLKPAVAIGLSYAMFLNPKLAFGGEINGYFFTTIADRQFFMAPIALRALYAIDLAPFVITPTFGAGLAITVLDDLRHVDPLLSLGSGFAWRFNNEVSYGLNVRFDFIPQFYIEKPEQNHSLMLFGVTLGATYHL